MGKDQIERLTNFLPLNRDFFNHSFWNENRTFSKAEAWLDLIRRANFKEEDEKTVMGYTTIRWGTGQLHISYRFLAQKWKWSPSKVERYIKFLIREGMVTVHTQNGQSILTLVNYSKYNLTGKILKSVDQSDVEIPDQVAGQVAGGLNPLQSQLSSDSRDNESDIDQNSSGTAAEQQRYNTNNLINENKLNNSSNTNGGVQKRKRNKREAPQAVTLPWVSEKFAEAWEKWKEYRRDAHKFSYKSPSTEQAALGILQSESGNNEEVAIEMINYSMSRGWKGIYEIKNLKNATTKPKPEQRHPGQYNLGW